MGKKNQGRTISHEDIIKFAFSKWRRRKAPTVYVLDVGACPIEEFVKLLNGRPIRGRRMRPKETT